jgi:hypothetical protein
LTIVSLLIVLPFVAVGCYRAGISVSVVNDSSGELFDVGLKYQKHRSEAVQALGTIPSDGTKSTRIVNDNESNLILTFRDARGGLHNEQIQIYLEYSHSPVTLHVSRDYSVRCEGCP